VNVPFVSVRSFLSPEQLEKPLDPGTLLRLLIRREAPALICDLKAGTLTWRGKSLLLPPAHLALYAFFLLAKQNRNCGAFTCRDCIDCYLEFGDVTSREKNPGHLYQRIPKKQYRESMSDTGILNLNRENFNSFKGKIRHQLLQAFGVSVDGLLTIEGRGKRPDTRYGIPSTGERSALSRRLKRGKRCDDEPGPLMRLALRDGCKVHRGNVAEVE